MCAQAHVSFVYEVFIFVVFMGSILIANIDFELHTLFFFSGELSGTSCIFFMSFL